MYDVAGKRNIWICTFANNQHELGELGGNVLLTPFARAILQSDCIGTLLLVDEKCTPMTRASKAALVFLSFQYVSMLMFRICFFGSSALSSVSCEPYDFSRTMK